MARYKFSYLLEYIPVRYQGLTPKQLQDRREIYNFKDGNASASIKTELLSKIKNITAQNPSKWVVCFIPASTRAKTTNRFQTLVNYLSREVGCEVCIDTVTNSIDSEAGHIAGKSSNPTEHFIINTKQIHNKNVVLIDDVITRGRTFDDTADKLINQGALSVHGLFVAKTIHPNLPQLPRGSRFYDDSFDIFEDMYEEEMAAELAIEEAYEEEMAAEQAYEDEMMAEMAAEEAFEVEMENEYYDYEDEY